jgi:hypothetical protein
LPRHFVIPNTLIVTPDDNGPDQVTSSTVFSAWGTIVRATPVGRGTIATSPVDGEWEANVALGESDAPVATTDDGIGPRDWCGMLVTLGAGTIGVVVQEVNKPLASTVTLKARAAITVRLTSAVGRSSAFWCDATGP